MIGYAQTNPNPSLITANYIYLRNGSKCSPVKGKLTAVDNFLTSLFVWQNLKGI